METPPTRRRIGARHRCAQTPFPVAHREAPGTLPLGAVDSSETDNPRTLHPPTAMRPQGQEEKVGQEQPDGRDRKRRTGLGSPSRGDIGRNSDRRRLPSHQPCANAAGGQSKALTYAALAVSCSPEQAPAAGRHRRYGLRGVATVRRRAGAQAGWAVCHGQEPPAPQTTPGTTANAPTTTGFLVATAVAAAAARTTTAPGRGRAESAMVDGISAPRSTTR
jgi:hypothetical protein